MKKIEEQDEIMNKIQKKIDKDIERMKSKKDMDKSVEKQIRKQLLDLYLFQSNESKKKSKSVDRLNKRAKDILEQNEQELKTNVRKNMSYIENKFIKIIKPKYNFNCNPYNQMKLKEKQLVNANDYYDLNQWKSLSQELRKEHPECQLCNKQKSTEVHHIFPFMHQFEDIREEVFLDKDNLICLCSDCHHQVHAKNYGNLGIPERTKIENLRSQISQKYLNQGKILSWL